MVVAFRILGILRAITICPDSDISLGQDEWKAKENRYGIPWTSPRNGSYPREGLSHSRVLGAYRPKPGTGQVGGRIGDEFGFSARRQV